jgi:hypothetical protein
VFAPFLANGLPGVRKGGSALSCGQELVDPSFSSNRVVGGDIGVNGLKVTQSAIGPDELALSPSESLSRSHRSPGAACATALGQISDHRRMRVHAAGFEVREALVDRGAKLRALAERVELGWGEQHAGSLAVLRDDQRLAGLPRCA